ncbi:MAG: hypothetical protein Q4C63_06645 [Eubacteriales bacterium]|nr:hypothetical protein [Eubacteriales bacterium]
MQENRRRTFSYTIWMLGGCYLIYLAYTLFKSETALTGVQLAFAVLFALVGLFFAVSGGYRMWQLDKEKKEQQKRDEKASSDGTDENE